MKVSEVMHPEATWVGPDTPLPQVEAKMREERSSALPISEYDRLVGVVRQSDIARCGAQAAKLTARDVMSSPIIYCYPEEETDDALRIMRKHAVRRLSVVSHQKRVIGSLTLADVGGETRSSTCA